MRTGGEAVAVIELFSTRKDPRNELLESALRNIGVRPGDALVLTKEDAEGRLILSKKRARFELAWKKIEGAAESGEPVVGRVIEVGSAIVLGADSSMCDPFGAPPRFARLRRLRRLRG